MIDNLENELKLTRPFRTPEEAVALAIMVTSEYIRERTAELFKSFELTLPQYNVLRILRGAGSDGLSCREIGERMITRDSDITRMLDRLEARGLLRRERQTDDRRVVLTFASDKGLELLSQLDGPVEKLDKSLVGHLSRKDMETLSLLLKKVRDPKRTVQAKSDGPALSKAGS